MRQFDILLDRLEKCISNVNAELGIGGRGLNSPATEAQLEAVEQLIDHKLPNDLRAFFLRFNGQPTFDWRHDPPQVWNFFPPFFKLPTREELLGCWQQDSDAYEERARQEALEMVDAPSLLEVIPYFPSPKRVLVGLSNMPVFLYCDLDPGEAGRPGQIVHFDAHDPDPWVYADSFAQALEMVVLASENGRIRFNSAERQWAHANGSSLGWNIRADLALPRIAQS